MSNKWKSTENVNIRTYTLLACKNGNNNKHEYKDTNTINTVTHMLLENRNKIHRCEHGCKNTKTADICSNLQAVRAQEMG